MIVEYMHCPYCGFEEHEKEIDAQIGGSYVDGQAVICPECGEETTDFDQYVDDNGDDVEVPALAD